MKLHGRVVAFSWLLSAASELGAPIVCGLGEAQCVCVYLCCAFPRDVAPFLQSIDPCGFTIDLHGAKDPRAMSVCMYVCVCVCLCASVCHIISHRRLLLWLPFTPTHPGI